MNMILVTQYIDMLKELGSNPVPFFIYENLSNTRVPAYARTHARLLPRSHTHLHAWMCARPLAVRAHAWTACIGTEFEDGVRPALAGQSERHPVADRTGRHAGLAGMTAYLGIADGVFLQGSQA